MVGEMTEQMFHYSRTEPGSQRERESLSFIHALNRAQIGPPWQCSNQ